MESLSVFREIGNPWGTALALDGLGCVASMHHQTKEADTFFQEGLALFKKSGNQRETGLTLCRIAESCLAQKEPAKARQNLLEALKIEMDIFAVPVVLRALSAWCLLSTGEGGLETALAYGLFIQGHSSAEWEVRNKLEEFLPKWQQGVGPEKAALILEGAKSLQLKEVVESLLKS